MIKTHNDKGEVIAVQLLYEEQRALMRRNMEYINASEKVELPKTTRPSSKKRTSKRPHKVQKEKKT